ncbi:neuronal acetylcholine receptor subunit alpha-7-like isoform X2 [Stylophora pistillata]|uniref:neuronal acetylcholine receptor subunit alpha-7-like isoform X2 n=1 Tax=Stylophora pistillata TaxID=50429 RepID=UPI000C04074D|nr:neuronal acetylcholine receptor subunit alpha-7-like isoform X2 [Stylophora pistillata]
MTIGHAIFSGLLLNLLYLIIVISSSVDVDVEHNNSDSEEGRLWRKLFLSNYNPELRPVLNTSEKVTVTLGVSLHQIINVDEKNQLMQVSLWIRQSWFNPILTWNKSEYGGMDQINIKANKLWIPDIYLYNNADANQDGALDRFKTKIVLSSNGRNMWLGPVLCTFSCKINVNFFPFDEQVDVVKEADEGDIKKYVVNGEWDLIGIPAQRNEVIYVCCPQPYPDVTYTIHIRRRSKYYYVNMIVPCALITSLTLLSFFLPPDSGERITLVITNLLAMTVFMLIVAEIMPATSEVIPLISIYYTGIMFEVGLSLVATCLSLKCYYNNPSVAEIPAWVRIIVLNWLAKLVRVKIPPGLVKVIKKHFKEKAEAREEIEFERRSSVLPPTGRCGGGISWRTSAFSEGRSSHVSEAASTFGLPQLFNTCAHCLDTINEEQPTTDDSPPQNIPLSLEVSMKEMLLRQDNLLKNVRRLVSVVRENEANEIKREEWKLVAAVIDACFFWLFMVTLIISTLAIFLQAPSY